MFQDLIHVEWCVCWSTQLNSMTVLLAIHIIIEIDRVLIQGDVFI